MLFLNGIQTELLILLNYSFGNLLFSLVIIYCLRISSLNPLYDWSVTRGYYNDMCLSCVIIEAISTIPTSNAYCNDKYDEPNSTPNLKIFPKYTIVGNLICNLMLQSHLYYGGLREKKHSD